jgi:ketosteroid isomerase-like protein
MRVMMVFFLASIMASAQSRPCNPKEMESEVRAVINRVMELRSRQDPRFLSFYADDEYSFPGESWSFQGRERIASREGEMKLARQSGISWRTDLRDVHLKAGCETSWIAATVHVEQIDSNGTVRSAADWRLTAVLERRNSNWVIVHQHSSQPTDPQDWWVDTPPNHPYRIER